jgi:hypothetical protein
MPFKKTVFFSILLALIVILSGCVTSGQSSISAVSPTINSTSVPESSPTKITSSLVTSPISSKVSSPYDIFSFSRVIWKTNGIFLRGTANLNDGSKLNIQIYKNDSPVDWIPEITTICIGKGWKADLMPVTTPYQFPQIEQGYSIKIRAEDNYRFVATFPLPYPLPTYSANNDLIASHWKLVSLKGKVLIPGTNITANFGIGDFNNIVVRGNSSVNSYGGYCETYAPDDIIVYHIDETLIGSSAEYIQQENAYLECLRYAFTYKIVSNNLEIFDAQKTKILVFENAL